MVQNLVFVLIGISLWFAVAHDAYAVQERTGQRVWGLTNRTWAWIVAITFFGLVPYMVGRTITTRSSTPPSA